MSWVWSPWRMCVTQTSSLRGELNVLQTLWHWRQCAVVLGVQAIALYVPVICCWHIGWRLCLCVFLYPPSAGALRLWRHIHKVYTQTIIQSTKKKNQTKRNIEIISKGHEYINTCTVRAPYSAGNQFFGTSEHYGKAHGVYYLDEWIIITLHIAGFLHPAIF